MTKLQWITIALATGLVVLLFFGFDTKSSSQKEILKSKDLAGTNIEIGAVIADAKKSLGDRELKELAGYELTLETRDLKREDHVAILKKLSSYWYRQTSFLIAGYYAEEVAQIENTGNAWGIAGTTYLAGIKSDDPLTQSGTFQGAIRSLENAISIDPDTIRHRVNLALAYVERPLDDNPMKGIQMLLSLNERNPDDVVVLNTLARLAIKTGQYDRAESRIMRVLEIDPQNKNANCQLVDIYRNTGNVALEAQRKKCDLLTSKE